MPWKASSVMEEKVRFVVEYEQDHYNMTELCQRYGIARETGYVWLRLYLGARAGRIGRVKPWIRSTEGPQDHGAFFWFLPCAPLCPLY